MRVLVRFSMEYSVLSLTHSEQTAEQYRQVPSQFSHNLPCVVSVALSAVPSFWLCSQIHVGISKAHHSPM